MGTSARNPTADCAVDGGVAADGGAGEFRSPFTAVGESLLPPDPNPNP